MIQEYNLTLAFAFLKKVKLNNNREWFAKHKNEYLLAHENMIAFADAVLLEMNKYDHIETPSGKKSLHRIYRDVRFSKNKTPYNTHFGGSLKRATHSLRGGYYYHLEQGNSFVAGGFWGPNAQDIKHIRQQIAADPDALKSILNNKTIKNAFGDLVGSKLKTAPRGFTVDHPAIDLLRYKQFILTKSFSDKEVFNSNFHKEMIENFQKMRYFFDYMSDILTTNLNGVSI